MTEPLVSHEEVIALRRVLFGGSRSDFDKEISPDLVRRLVFERDSLIREVSLTADLYEVVRRLIAWDDAACITAPRQEPWKSVIEPARAALAKADGRSAAPPGETKP